MPVFRLALFHLTLLALWFSGPLGAPAEATPTIAKPTGRVILTIDGNIERTNGARGAEFDRAMLEALGMVEIETETPFTSGPVTFRGVRMGDLLRHVGARGRTVEATALDLYKADIPVADFDNDDVILALELNGRKLRVRDRGPAWIMYPFSSHAHLDNEIIHSRCIWQLVSLTVR